MRTRSRNANYKNIPEYNEALKKMADDLGVCWIDCDSYLDDYPELYDTDGQHFFPDMYPIWARTMLKAAFDYEYEQTGDADALSQQVSANASAAEEAKQAAETEGADTAQPAEGDAESADETTDTSGDCEETSAEDGETSDDADGGTEETGDDETADGDA